MTSGGAERVISTLANELVSSGHESVIGMLKGEDSAYVLDSRVLLRSAKLTPGLKNFFPSVHFYRTLIAQEKPDLVVSFSTKTDIISLLSRIFQRTQARLIVSERNDPYTRGGLMQTVCNLLYRAADAIVCQSESVANYYRRKCPSVDVRVVSNPLNLSSVATPTQGSKSPYVFTVGRLYAQKNHRLAIESFRLINARYPDLRLHIFGEGPLKPELKQFISASGLEGVVELRGVKPNVISEHSDAAAFLFTSDHEGFPNALMEAAASGVPSVTTDFSPGTAKEIIRSGSNGYIVPRNDAAAVAEALSRVLSNELDPNQVVREANTLRRKHTTNRILSEWIVLFDSVKLNQRNTR